MNTQKTILVIEDDEMMRTVIKTTLSQYGWNVTTASSGQEAAGILNRKTFDVVHTDGDLGDTDGTTITKALLMQSPNAFVVMLSGDDHRAQSFLSIGGKRFFHKLDSAAWRSYFESKVA